MYIIILYIQSEKLNQCLRSVAEHRLLTDGEHSSRTKLSRRMQESGRFYDLS